MQSILKMLYRVFLILLSLGAGVETNAQKNIEYNYLSVAGSKEIKPIDLTYEARKKCDRMIKRQIGKSYLEVRYPSAFAPEAEIVTQKLFDAIKKTQEILSPLPPENVRFYLLQRENIPVSFKIVEVRKMKIFTCICGYLKIEMK